MRSCDDVIVITNLNKVGVLFQFFLYPAPKEFGTGTHLLISIIIKYISRLSYYESENSPDPFKAELMTYLSDWPGGASSESPTR